MNTQDLMSGWKSTPIQQPIQQPICITQVLTIEELNKLIPETIVVEPHSDFQSTIKYVIDMIEESNKWEFVQYVQGKPSLFIIRDEVKKRIGYKFKQNPMEEIHSHYNETATISSPDVVNEEQQEDEQHGTNPELNENPNHKFPWSKL